MNMDMRLLLEWLGYSKGHTVVIDTISAWAKFTRRVCYFSNHGSKHLYKQILPSRSALNLHKLRGDYVMILALEIDKGFSDHYKEVSNFGWKSIGSNCEFIWDENIDVTRRILNKKRPLPKLKCGCKTAENKCAISSKGCKNCVKSCRPCTNACACKGVCLNPHNDG